MFSTFLWLLLALTIYKSVGSNSCQAENTVSVNLRQVASHTTYGNAGYEFFEIDSKPFLAVANFWDGEDRSMGAYSEIVPIHQYPDDGSVSMLTSSSMKLWTQGAHGVDYFEIPTPKDIITKEENSPPNYKKFIVFPSYYGCEGTGIRPCNATTILIWKEDANQFAFFQSLDTDDPSQTDHFSLPNSDSHYLVVAENFANKLTIYKYDLLQNIFVPEQSLPCPGVAAIAVTVLLDRILLIAASYHHPQTQWHTKSPVFVWHFNHPGSTTTPVANFHLIQELSTQGAHDVETLYTKTSTGQEQLLMFFSEDRNENGPLIDSQVFRYDFVQQTFHWVQSIPTDGAHAAELFAIQAFDRSFIFLAIANFGDRHGKRYTAGSVVLWYSEEEEKFLPVVENIPTIGATDWEYFTRNGYHYLAVSNEGDLQNHSNPFTESPIYELTLQYTQTCISI